jgi:uncharacterized protein (TIGR04255 family)
MDYHTSMDQTVTYRKAPLVELIVEVRWPVQTIGLTGGPPIVTGQSVAFDLWFLRLTDCLRAQGFHNLERMIPHEMFVMAHQPIYRYSGGTKFPIIQFGYGIFTVNAGPPDYHSWNEFLPQVDRAITALVGTRPIDEPVIFSRVALRYIDCFDADLRAGASNYAFIHNDLGITFGLPSGLIELATNPNQINPTFAMSLPIDGEDNANVTFQIAAARLGDSQTADTLIDMAYTVDGDTLVATTEVLARLHKAYIVLHGWFEKLTVNIRARMEPVQQDQDGKNADHSRNTI